MKRERLSYLFGGFAFGILFGFGLFHAIANRPGLTLSSAPGAELSSPQGPPAPTQVAPSASAAAPMMGKVNELKRKLQDAPQDIDALTQLAYLYHDVSMPDQAVGYYERAVAIRPDDPDLLTDLGACYRALGQFDRALDRFARAHRVDPQHWQSLFNTALVAAFDVGRIDLAMDALRSLDALDPRPPEMDAHLGELREALERARAARGEAGGPS